MVEIDARKALEQSLQKDSKTYVGKGVDRQAFLNSARDKLLELAISPTPVQALADDWALEHGEFDRESYEMVAIAGQGSSWLLFDPDTQMFSLADGTIDGELVLVGFRSNDALAEWRG